MIDKLKKLCFDHFDCYNKPSDFVSILLHRLSKPTLNTSNELKKQIQDLQENADLSRILKEMRLSENVQAALNEEAARLLNYKLSDRKYTNLISLEDEIQPPILKHRSRPAYIGRKKDESLKPDVREFWSPEEFITEKPKMNFKVNLHDEDDVDEEEKESFDYLLDTYKRNECLPYQIFSTK